ncbi:MAG TPA: TonB-dependent receptor [Steroidobacteraceae bacterium]|nr:TonB-dependent receptor [Steroidobacteraceae bacterium]
MAGINRIKSASALAALSISVSAIAQQTPAANPPAGEEVDTVVVTGVREALAKGLENKRESPQVIESIVAEDIGKLPDNNVIEALQRVPGVQISDRGRGEATRLFIRGLPDPVTTWNGRNMFTSNGRQLQLQDIPANLVGQIDVYKTRSSEQLETGLAGQIDVVTRRPFDLPGLQMSLNATYTQQEQRDAGDPSLSMLVSNQWDVGDGRFGALLNVSYTKSRWRDQTVIAGAMLPFATPAGLTGLGAAADNCDSGNPNWTPLERIFNTSCRNTPDNLPPGTPEPLLWQAGLDRGLPWTPGSTLTVGGTQQPYLLTRDALIAVDAKGDRERPAATVALQFAPNDTSEYTFETFYQGYRHEIFNNLHFTFADAWWALGPNPASTFTLYPDTNVIKTRTVGEPGRFQSGDAIDEWTDTWVYALAGKWSVGDKLTLKADVSFQDSSFETNFIAMRTNNGMLIPSLSLDFNAGDGIPSWHFNDDAAMLDPNNWLAAELFQNRGKQDGDAATFQLDGDYDFAGDSDAGWFKQLKFGVRYDDRNSKNASPRPVAPATIGFPSFSTIDPAFYYVNDSFMDGEADVPTTWLVANGFYMNDHRDDLRAIYGVETADPTLIESFDVNETTSAAYLQADMKFGEKFDAQVGVRFVKVDTDMVFTDVISLVAADDSASVDDLMPSLTLRYAVTPEVNVRFNYGETLRRPDFTALNPNFALTQDLTNVGYGTGTGGNPDLEATKSKNMDLTVEWYFAEDSAIFGTLFERDIDGLVVPLTRRITIPNTGLNTDQFVVTQPVNASDGELKGLELGFLWFPTLPGAFNGLGLQGSYTQLDSEQNIPLTNSAGEIIGQETSSFFGVSDTSYNVTLAYDHSGFGGRLSYVWREDFLSANEARLFANPIGQWRLPEKSLDLQLNYDFNDNLSVSFDAVNLMQDLQQSYYKFADAGNPTVSNFGTTLISRSYSLGVRWKY